MEQLRFDSGLGVYDVSVSSESVWITRGAGAHDLRVPVAVGVPEVGPAAGRLLCLETALFATQNNGPPARLGSANVSVPFRPDGEIRRADLGFLVSNAQLLALEQRRVGDLRLELRVNGYLPQASGFPGGGEVTVHIAIAESRWRQQLAGLGRSLGVDMVIPFPTEDDHRRAAAEFLREAQRLLGGNDINAAMLQARKALETIKGLSGWAWPGNKPKNERSADERWAWIRAALEEQASGAMHVDGGTKDHNYSRAEAEALIAMTAALLTTFT